MTRIESCLLRELLERKYIFGFRHMACIDFSVVLGVDFSSSCIETLRRNVKVLSIWKNPRIFYVCSDRKAIPLQVMKSKTGCFETFPPNCELCFY